MGRFHHFALLALATLSGLSAATTKSKSKPISTPFRRLETTGFQPVGSDLFGVPAYNETGRGKVQFGATVALASATGTRLVVGAPLHDFKDNGEVNVNGGGIFLYELTANGEWDAENPLWSLYGELGEELGQHLSLSADGTRVALRRTIPNSVEVYDIPSGSQVGTSLFCEGAGDAVTLSPSGSRLAMSCRSTAGLVEIFDFDSATGDWLPIGELVGLANNDLFGFTTAFSSSGDRLSIASPKHDGANGSNSGMVQVFEYADSSWNQLGGGIVGLNAQAQFGFSMDFSGDGSTFVASAPSSSSNGLSANGEGSVFAFDSENDTWNQVGSTIPGRAGNDRLGRSLSISQDGSRFAIGSFNHNQARGQVLLFEFSDSSNDWVEIASATGNNVGDRLSAGRFSVSLSADGAMLAVGEAFARNGESQDVGRVLVLGTSVEDPASPLTAAPSPTSTSLPTVSTTNTPTAAPSEAQTTAAPTASPSGVTTATPTSSPTVPGTSSPTSLEGTLSKLQYDLEHLATVVRFSEETDTDEIVLTYAIARRDFAVHLFQDDCTTRVPDTIIAIDAVSVPYSPTHNTLEVSLDIMQDKITESIYSQLDAATGLLALCTRVELVDADGTPVVFHEIKHVITLALTNNFSITSIDLKRIDATEDTFSVDLEYGVTACHCDDSFDCFEEEGIVSQNSIVNLCVQTSVDNIEIDDIRELKLVQAGLSHTTIQNGTADAFTEVVINPNGDGKKAVVRTLLLSSFFASDEPEDVIASGMCAMTFRDDSGNTRRLRASISFETNRELESDTEETGFGVALAINSETSSSAPVTGLSVVAAVLVAAVSALI